jgi:hypothetical protein
MPMRIVRGDSKRHPETDLTRSCVGYAA